MTLSLTLGAAASVFAIVDAVLLTAPPFANPAELFTLGERAMDGSTTAAPRRVTYATLEAWRERARALATLEAFDGTNLTLTEVGPAERLQVTDATPGLLALLGVSPELGRTFGADDIGRAVAIVSHAFWQRTLGGDRNIIGREIVLGGKSHTVIGVLPPEFTFALGRAEVWRPLAVPQTQRDRDGLRVGVIARLAAPARATDLAAVLDEVSGASQPPARTIIMDVISAIVGDRETTLRLLTGAVLVALGIAFANLAGLLLVRSIDRRRELAMRTALGAGRSENTRQLLMEGGLIVAIGTIAGLVLAWWLTPIVGDVTLERIGEFATREIVLGWRVIAGLALAAGLCAAICAWLPAQAMNRWSVIDVLRRGVTPSVRELAWRRAFVVGEVTLAFVLLVSMSLLGRSLFALLGSDPGFSPQGVVVLQVALPRVSYPIDGDVVKFYADLEAGLAERLGPRAAAIVDEIPLTGSGGRRSAGVRPDDVRQEVVVRSVSADYFEVMRIRIAEGGTFTSTDGGVTSARRGVISQALAREFFGTDSPVGRELWLGGEPAPVRIVGVVGDVKHGTLDESVIPTLYVWSAQEGSASSIVVVRSEQPQSVVIATVREVVSRLDPSIPVYRVRAMTDVVAASPGLPARQMLTSTFAGLAVLALALSAIGLYGVAAHDIACRRVELALRAALGAHPARMLRATLGRGILTVCIGLMVGGALSWFAANALRSISASTGRADVFGVAVAGAVLLLTGIVAALPAAVRASRVNPGMVLHGE